MWMNDEIRPGVYAPGRELLLLLISVTGDGCFVAGGILGFFRSTVIFPAAFAADKVTVQGLLTADRASYDPKTKFPILWGIPQIIGYRLQRHKVYPPVC